VESTDISAHVVEPAGYLVPEWVRVRREDFGVLFYDARSTRLTFVRSGDSLEPPPFTDDDRVLRVVLSDGKPRAAIARLLESLLAKGLIVAIESD